MASRLDGTLAMTVELRTRSDADFAGALEFEWNLNLLGGGHNPAAYYRFGAEEARHDSRGAVDAGVGLSFGNEHEGVDISVAPLTARRAGVVPGRDRLAVRVRLRARLPGIVPHPALAAPRCRRAGQRPSHDIHAQAGAAQRVQLKEGSKPSDLYRSTATRLSSSTDSQTSLWPVARPARVATAVISRP